MCPSRIQLRAGQLLYQQGRPALAVYPLRKGSIKNMFESSLGWRQITSFTLAGDVLGLEAHDSTAHTTSAIALQDASCCVVPVESLRMQMRLPEFRAMVLDTLRRNTERERTLLVAIGSMKAAQRLAMLLLDLAGEHGRRGGGDSLTLAMSRNDIASYLGLTLETVSRLLSRFASAGLITVRHKLLRIVDQGGLAAVYADASHLPDPHGTAARGTVHASRQAA
ncbi:Crp/Fnr family transcriptional regulator [Cupriavidus sp. USMAA2-4]|uniref:Crp/Fnr family transcriptional regulator n=1 Tax=Cupriavidus malaysiensis TaxID=367825 RepID=A0ABN4TZE4_9BURK|nr:Crp/Fnr family transcriptional regulator [Cupriavidus sp. USMAA2-4]AOZ03930.1 Crp/Fnr family transcriptional regulator [Cupriavidus sp. USMAHM13]AOZ11003.1 Crp/Fnr family transcriptional regulator [Cupriavidus malaysiensis]